MTQRRTTGTFTVTTSTPTTAPTAPCHLGQIEPPGIEISDHTQETSHDYYDYYAGPQAADPTRRQAGNLLDSLPTTATSSASTHTS